MPPPSKMAKKRPNEELSSDDADDKSDIESTPKINVPTNNNEKSFTKILYEDNAPQTDFFVLIDFNPEKTEDNEKKRINELKLYSILKTNQLVAGFKQVKRIGRRRCKVQFETSQQANKIINAENILLKHQLRAFIPISFVYKFGIIKEVPKSFTVEELKDDLILENPAIAIKDVIRFTRSDTDNPQLRRPTNTIKVAFLGNSIPSKVYLHTIPLRVDYYIPKPKQCNKCGRLGHLKDLCKNTKTPCLKCGKIPKCENECDQETHKCILCGSKDHTCATATIHNCAKKNEQQ